MAAPAGHDPSISMLEAGGGKIIPTQAGGNPTIAALDKIYKDLDTLSLSPAENTVLGEVAKGAVAAAAISNKDPYTAARIAVDTHLEKLREKGEYAQLTDFLNTASTEEVAAAKKAVDAAKSNPEYFTTDNNQKKNYLIKVGATAILDKRKNRIQIEKNRILKETQNNAITTSKKEEIIALQSIKVYKEFYKVIDQDVNEFNKVISNRNAELNNDIYIKSLYKDAFNYRQYRLKQWNRTNQKERMSSPNIPSFRQNNNIGADDKFIEFSKYIHCLPLTTESIVIVPAINGREQILSNTLYNLKEINAITYNKIVGKDNYKVKKGVVIIFMAPFFKEGIDTTNNLLLFSIFIDLNKRNPDQVFLMSENSVNYYKAGALINQKLKPADLYKETILTMIGPSYIVYPYDRPNLDGGIIITGARRDDNNNLPSSNAMYSISDLKKDSTYGTQVGFTYKVQSPNTELNEYRNIFTIRSDTTKKHDRNINIQPENNKPNGNSCSSLLSSDELKKIKTGKIYLDSVRVSNEPTPFVLVIDLNPSGKQINICKETIKIQPFEAKDKFYENVNAYKQVEKIHITLNENIYSIRVPNIEGDGTENKVSENWKNLIFTDEEAKFLNSVRFTPGILEAIFKDTWKTELSNFLNNLVLRNCVSDVNLLTKADCHSSRIFLNKVNEYFIDNYLAADLVEYDTDPRRDQVDQNKIKKNHKKFQPPPILSTDAIVIPDTRTDDIREVELGNFRKSKYYHNEPGELHTSSVRATIVGINKTDGSHKYYTISAPYNGKQDNEKEVQALTAKFKSLKVKYPNYIFIF
jgi:hypothetical protein